MLTQARLKTLVSYDPDTGIFIHLSGRNKGKQAGGLDNSTGYLQLWLDNKKYRLHTLAWLYVTGSYPLNIIDHKNRIKTDNRFHNLRDTTHSINNRNISLETKTTSGMSGVFWDKKRQKWNVKVNVDGKRVFARYYDSLEEAKAIRLSLIELHKDIK